MPGERAEDAELVVSAVECLEPSFPRAQVAVKLQACVWPKKAASLRLQELQLEPTLFQSLDRLAWADESLLAVRPFTDCLRVHYQECVPHTAAVLQRLEQVTSVVTQQSLV